VPALAHEADRLDARVGERRQAGIIGRAAPRAVRHAEGGEACAPERRRIGEEGVVGRVGAGPAALDVVDAETVERLRDRPLVLDAEIDALRLRAVAQRAVVKMDAPVVHGPVLPRRGAARQPPELWGTTHPAVADRRTIASSDALCQGLTDMLWR